MGTMGRFASSHTPIYRRIFCNHLLTNNQNVLSTNFWAGINIPAENRQRLSGPGKHSLSWEGADFLRQERKLFFLPDIVLFIVSHFAP